MIAMVLMAGLMLIWFKFFMPQRVPPEEQQRTAQTAQAPEVDPATPGAAPDATANADTAWPFLPPVATQDDPADDEVVLENEHLRAVFTKVGGRLKHLDACLNREKGDFVQFVPETEEVSDAEATYPFALSFPAQAGLGNKLNTRRFDAALDPSGQTVTFTLATKAVVITKRFTLPETAYVLDAEVGFQNLGEEATTLGRDLTPGLVLTWGPKVASTDQGSRRMGQTLFWRKDGENDSIAVRKLDPEDPPTTESDVDWVCVKSTYFTVALKPEFTGARSWAAGGEENYAFGLAAPRFQVPAQATETHAFRVYAGPNHMEYLGAAWESLPTVQRIFTSVDIMDWFAKKLLWLLRSFYNHVYASWGIAIILVTIIVRVSMLPLTMKSMKSMKKMQLLAPEIEKLKAKHGEDNQEMQKKMMELYRERGVNPLGGCLPMLLQMPVFITLYRMLSSAYELRGAPFALLNFGDYTWIQDLSKPDHLIHMPFMTDVPFVGQYLEYFNLLPILMAGAMVISQKVLPTSGPSQNSQQKMMMTFMPIFFSIVCYTMPAGLNLYIFVSTVLGIAQQAFTRYGGGEVDISPKKKKGPRKRQHFYTAAQSRKRRLVKEGKTSAKHPGKAKGADKAPSKKTGK